MNPSIHALPDKSFPFVWRYLRNKKWHLAGLTFVAIVHSIEISLNPYLLKVLINTAIQFSTDRAKMVAAILIPAAIYIALPMILNSNLRHISIWGSKRVAPHKIK
ncbi:MAG: hypothetical protein LEGION0403_FIIPPAGN_02683 [Legionella sp.]|uniref:hypothetical protein n=1 Tax=Legionella sp. TaxID=459 RepID=UPI003D1234BD